MAKKNAARHWSDVAGVRRKEKEGKRKMSACVCGNSLLFADEKACGKCHVCQPPSSLSVIHDAKGRAVPVSWSYPELDALDASGVAPSKGGTHVLGGTVAPKCEHDGKIVFTTPNGTTFSAANNHGVDRAPCDIILDLAGVASAAKPWIDSKFKPLASLAETCEPPMIARLHWSDMQAPPAYVGLRFWRALLDTVAGKRVCVCCVGGHGRTGTALCCILIASGMVLDADEAVRFVREEHCPKSVESAVQLEYLHRLATEAKEGK